MIDQEFQREVKRLRDHFGDRHYTSELVARLWREFGQMPLKDFRAIILEAIATRQQGRPPLRDDFRAIASEIGVNAALTSAWRYLEVSDCLTCGGAGWYYITRLDGGSGIVACNDCPAGKNMQSAPRPHVNFTIQKVQGAVYDRPGR